MVKDVYYQDYQTSKKATKTKYDDHSRQLGLIRQLEDRVLMN